MPPYGGSGHIYGSCIFSSKKTNHSHTHYKITSSAKMKPYSLHVQQKVKWKFSKQPDITFYLTTSLKPTYTCRISSYQHLRVACMCCFLLKLLIWHATLYRMLSWYYLHNCLLVKLHYEYDIIVINPTKP